MTAHELVLYIRGASKRSTTLAWMTARFAMEGLSKKGLRALSEVLAPIEGGGGYDQDAADAWVRMRIQMHNERLAAGEA